jgi:predicted secreted protein
MHRRLLIPALALATLSVASAPAAAKQVTLTIADSGHTVTVHRGDTIRVALKANETTPYHWVVTKRPDRSVARVTSARYVQSAGEDGGMVGVGGTQRYTLDAVRAGSTRFVTQYQEISTGEVSGSDSRFAVRIRVR